MAAQSPYLKPSIPFTGSIYGGLRDGMTVIVCGTARQCCERFKIDFQCGFAPLPQADVAFHCNPRFDEGCVVANSFEKGKWQCEERTREMPFRRGYPFEVRFHVNNISFKVDVDGRYLLEFKHRIALSRVDAVSISGDVEVAFIYFQSPTDENPCSRPAVVLVWLERGQNEQNLNGEKCEAVSVNKYTIQMSLLRGAGAISWLHLGGTVCCGSFRSRPILLFHAVQVFHPPVREVTKSVLS